MSATLGLSLAQRGTPAAAAAATAPAAPRGARGNRPPRPPRVGHLTGAPRGPRPGAPRSAPAAARPASAYSVEYSTIGALLATPDRDKMAQQLAKARIDEERIAELERAIDDAEVELEPLRAFILPGGTPKAAALHVARSVVRRRERRLVTLDHRGGVQGPADGCLNRLDDLLFVLARVLNRHAGGADVQWQQRKNQ